MPIKISEEKINTVQQKYPSSRIIPPNSAKVTSWYRKGEIQPWIKSVEDWDAIGDKLLLGDFAERHGVEFTSERGETPEGTKVFYLTEGIYFGKIFKDKDDKKGRYAFFAVTDKGKLEEISEDQASDLVAEANGKTFAPKPKEKSPNSAPDEKANNH